MTAEALMLWRKNDMSYVSHQFWIVHWWLPLPFRSNFPGCWKIMAISELGIYTFSNMRACHVNFIIFNFHMFNTLLPFWTTDDAKNGEIWVTISQKENWLHSRRWFREVERDVRKFRFHIWIEYAKVPESRIFQKCDMVHFR